MDDTVTGVRRITTRVGSVAVWQRPGPGTPVVMWPSLFADHVMYDELVAALDDSWAPVVLDGPGFGLSSPPLPRVQPGRYAHVVCDLLDGLGIDRAGFVGTSWGGQIGAHLAADHADRVGFALLANTPVEPAQGGSVFRLLAGAVLGPSRFYGRRVAAAMLSDADGGDVALREAMVARFPTFRRRAMTRTATTTLRHFPGVTRELGRAAVPVTVVMGRDDRLYPPERTRAALGDPPGQVELAEVPGCGHLAPLEAPAVVADLLGDLRRRARS